jgi:hypothetical protein
MKLLSVIIVVIATCGYGNSQSPPDQSWGVVHLIDGSTVEGQFRFYHATRLEYLNNNRDVESL